MRIIKETIRKITVKNGKKVMENVRRMIRGNKGVERLLRNKNGKTSTRTRKMTRKEIRAMEHALHGVMLFL